MNILNTMIKIFYFSLFSFSLVISSCFQEQTELRKVSLRLNWTPNAEHAFLYLGIDKGFFREKGLDLEILPGEGSTLVAKLVGNRNNDFGLMSGDVLVMAVIKGVPLKAIATLYHDSPACIYSLKGKGIIQPKDLEGRKLGVLIKSTTYQQYLGMLTNAGVNRAKINEVPVIGIAQELLSGKIDAAMHYTNYLPIQINYLGHDVNEILMKNYGITIYSQSIVANTKIIKVEPDIVQNFLDATLNSLVYSKTHLNEAMNSLMKHNPELNRNVQELMLKRTNALFFNAETKRFGVGYMTQQGWAQTQKTLSKVGLIDKEIDPNTFFDDSFWQKYKNAGALK